MLTPRKRVELALHGGHADKVPFTIYAGGHCPQCAAERAMRNRGLCLVERRSPIQCVRPNVKQWSKTYTDAQGITLIRTFYETPAGTLTTLCQPAEGTTWYLERMYKTPDDFKAMLFLIRDEHYQPAYEIFAAMERRFGEDAICRGTLPAEPMQFLISGQFFDTAQFCVEWMDHRDEILKLYEARVARNQEQYALIAASPARHFNMGGNVVPEIIGREMFKKYYVPHYNEAAEIIHRQGKLIGCHFDANCRLFSRAIAGTALDYIEAFTPAPDTDMTLGEARAAWPDKVIWLNYSSSVHLRSDAAVQQFTVDLLNQVPTVDGIIMGITEDIPPDRWQASCTAIMDGLDRHAREKPALYGKTV